jgi:hypothetical protein
VKYLSKRVLEMVHGDLYGPITPTTPRGGGGKKMFLLLIDNFSRYMWIVLLPSMDGVLEAIK